MPEIKLQIPNSIVPELVESLRRVTHELSHLPELLAAVEATPGASDECWALCKEELGVGPEWVRALLELVTPSAERL